MDERPPETVETEVTAKRIPRPKTPEQLERLRFADLSRGASIKPLMGSPPISGVAPPGTLTLKEWADDNKQWRTGRFYRTEDEICIKLSPSSLQREYDGAVPHYKREPEMTFQEFKQRKVGKIMTGSAAEIWLRDQWVEKGKPGGDLEIYIQQQVRSLIHQIKSIVEELDPEAQHAFLRILNHSWDSSHFVGYYSRKPYACMDGFFEVWEASLVTSVEFMCTCIYYVKTFGKEFPDDIATRIVKLFSDWSWSALEGFKNSKDSKAAGVIGESLKAELYRIEGKLDRY